MDPDRPGVTAGRRVRRGDLPQLGDGPGPRPAAPGSAGGARLEDLPDLVDRLAPRPRRPGRPGTGGVRRREREAFAVPGCKEETPARGRSSLSPPILPLPEPEPDPPTVRLPDPPSYRSIDDVPQSTIRDLLLDSLSRVRQHRRDRVGEVHHSPARVPADGGAN